MGSEHIETIIIGAGQAGLASAYHLKQRGREAVVLEALERTGDNWRRHYDSLKLYSHARLDGLPGTPFPGPATNYPVKDEVADFLEAYVAEHDLAVRHGVWVRRLAHDGERYVLETSDGLLTADNVIVATGTFGKPKVPAFAADLDPSIVQMHSSEYKNPSQLQPGPVLVVGASHSGADIALEVAQAGHDTILSGRNTGQLPFDIEGGFFQTLTPVISFVWRKVLSLKTPIGRRMQLRNHGGPLLRVKEPDLLAAGVDWSQERTERVSADGRPVLADGREVDVANVIWATGFKQNFSWIDLPVIGEDGWPLETRGIVETQPGLYFAGLAFQFAFSSMLILGAGQDAEFVVKHLDARMSTVAAPAAA